MDPETATDPSEKAINSVRDTISDHITFEHGNTTYVATRESTVSTLVLQ